MIEFGGLIKHAGHHRDFAQEVEEIARQRVDPAVQEIEERVRDNHYLRQLAERLVPDIQTIASGLLAFGMSQVSDLPGLVAPGLVAFQTALGAELDRRKEQNDLQRHQLYFLYRTNKLLGKNKE
jgi:hypothetical protein